MKSIYWVLAGCLLIGFNYEVAKADLPTEASLRLRVSLTSRTRGSVRITPSINSVLGLGESCEVTVLACLQNFAPVNNGPSPETRRCNPREIGVANMTAGDSSVSIRTRAARAKENRRGLGKQLTIGAEVECTDGTNDVELLANPKARKFSVNGNNGRGSGSLRRILNQLTSNFTG